jgi:hypothetical protein
MSTRKDSEVTGTTHRRFCTLPYKNFLSKAMMLVPSSDQGLYFCSSAIPLQVLPAEEKNMISNHLKLSSLFTIPLQRITKYSRQQHTLLRPGSSSYECISLHRKTTPRLSLELSLFRISSYPQNKI